MRLKAFLLPLKLQPFPLRCGVQLGLLRLRQICNHPRLVDEKFRGSSGKFELLLETLDTLRAEGHKALIFSQFVQMLTIIRDQVQALIDEGLTLEQVIERNPTFGYDARFGSKNGPWTTNMFIEAVYRSLKEHS